MRPRALAVAVLSLGVIASGMTSAVASASSLAPESSSSAAAPLSAELAQVLIFSRDEERMARDLYTALAHAHGGARPMGNIMHAEQRHFDMVGSLLQKYGIADPAAGKPAGQYVTAEIQGWYDGWLERGLKSYANAVTVGAELERQDIADLEEALGSVTQPDVVSTLQRLLEGSRRHLAAFERNGG